MNCMSTYVGANVIVSVRRVTDCSPVACALEFIALDLLAGDKLYVFVDGEKTGTFQLSIVDGTIMTGTIVTQPQQTQPGIHHQ